MNHKIAARGLKGAMLLALAAWLVGCGEPPPSTVTPPPPSPSPPPQSPRPAPAPAPVQPPPPPPRAATANGGQPVTSAPCVARDLAPFPWPNAPEPSVSTLIPPYLLFSTGSEGKSLLDVARRLEGSIAGAGYLEPKYLGAGCNGFAIMLDLEHIETDGARKPGAAGFAPSSQEQGFSLAGYIKRLFYAPPGYYRQIVFVVSDEGMGPTTPQPTEGELRAIAKDGSAALPPSYGKLPYSWKYKVVALVYEFQKGPNDGDARQIPPTGRLGATVHLKKARLY